MRGRWRRIALVVLCVPIAVWLIAPSLIVIPMSFNEERSLSWPPKLFSTRWYQNFFSDPAWYSSAMNSLRIAVVVMIIAVILGTIASFGIVRGRFPGREVVRAVFLAPMAIPLVVLGIGIYAVFLRWHLTGSYAGFILAHTCMALPFVVVTVSARLQTFDRSLESASASLGAPPWRTFLSVTLPVIRPAVLAGAVFAFTISFDEAVVALFLQGPELRTLPVQIYSSVTREIDPTIAAAATMVLGVIMLAMLSVIVLRRRTK